MNWVDSGEEWRIMRQSLLLGLGIVLFITGGLLMIPVGAPPCPAPVLPLAVVVRCHGWRWRGLFPE
jgi:hypothetical protein